MAGITERVGYLEGRRQAMERRMDDMRDAVTSLERRMDARFEGVDRLIDLLDRRLTSLDDKVTRYFVWLVGVQVTTLATVVTALAAGAIR
jgi:hypothetical protein